MSATATAAAAAADAGTQAVSTTSSMLSVPGYPSDVTNPVRPKFNSQNTQDRLREGEGLHGMLFRVDSNLQKGRRSVFRETGLDGDWDTDSVLTDVTLNSPPAAQELPPFHSENGRGQAGSMLGERQDSAPLKLWYVFDVVASAPRR